MAKYEDGVLRGLLETFRQGEDLEMTDLVVDQVVPPVEGVDMMIEVPPSGCEQKVQQRFASGLKKFRRLSRCSTAKDRISKMPPCAAGKRSSIYRGVTRHRWTGRYEAHLWDKTTWNESQNKKGKQVYLGAYDEEEAAARAYDLAALKYWGPGTLINFPLSDYTRDIEEMQNVAREDYLASLRRKSSGFSRGVSKYRGIARHNQNGRWEARIGRVFGNKYLYLGTYCTQEDAAAAYDMAAIEYRGLNNNAGTPTDLTRYLRWLRPEHGMPEGDSAGKVFNGGKCSTVEDPQSSQDENLTSQQQVWPAYPSSLGPSRLQHSSSSPSALDLLLQSSMFKQMLERAASAPLPDGSDSLGVNSSSTVSHENDQQQHAVTRSNSLYHSSWANQGAHPSQQQPGQQQQPTEAFQSLIGKNELCADPIDDNLYRHAGYHQRQHGFKGHSFQNIQDLKQQHGQQGHSFRDIQDLKQQHQGQLPSSQFFSLFVDAVTGIPQEVSTAAGHDPNYFQC